MAYSLKLDIYSFQLKKIKSSTTGWNKNGKEVIRHHIENEFVSSFDEVVKSFINEDTKDKPYMEAFLFNFMKSFNSSFVTNDENTKAISITEDLQRGFSSQKFTAWGMYKGGTTGILRDVYKNNNANDITGKLLEDNVASLSFFYKLWIPQDSNMGFVMLQSYTSTGCTALFKERFEKYVENCGYKVFWRKIIPDSYVKLFLSNAFIREIRVEHVKKEANGLQSPTFSLNNAKSVTILNKLNIPLQIFFSVLDFKQKMQQSIQCVDMNYAPDEDDVRLIYEHDGRTVHARLTKVEDILPAFILNDALKTPGTQIPDFEAMNTFTDSILEEIKKKIGYTPKSL